MAERPLVSIITPTLNSVKHLPRCIASVLGQSYERIEFIVVDGASTDGTVECLRALPAGVRWISEPLEGLGEALNQAVAQAKGDIICWLDAADEFFATNTVEIAVQSMLARPDADVVFGKALSCDDDLLRQTLVVPETEVSLASLLRAREVPSMRQSAMFLRRRVFEWVGPYVSVLPTGRDFEHWLRMAASGLQFAFVDQILARTRSGRFAGPARIQQQLILQQIRARYLHHLDRTQRIAFWKDHYLWAADHPELGDGKLQTKDGTEMIGRQLAKRELGRELELQLLAQQMDQHRSDSDYMYVVAEAFQDAGHQGLAQKIYDFADQTAVSAVREPTEAPTVMVPSWDLDELTPLLEAFFAGAPDGRPRFLRMLVEPKSGVPAHVARFHVVETIQALGRSPDLGDRIELVVADAEDVVEPIGASFLTLAGKPVPEEFEHLIRKASARGGDSSAPPNSDVAPVQTPEAQGRAPVVPIRSFEGKHSTAEEVAFVGQHKIRPERARVAVG